MRAAIPFDTLEYMEELRESGMDMKQAEAITKATHKAFNEMMEVKDLATKKDVRDSEIAVRKDMKEMEVALKTDIRESEIALRKDMKEMETSLRSDMKEMEMSLRSDMKEMEMSLHKEIKELELNTQKELRGLDLKISEIELRLTKTISSSMWKTVGMIIAFQALMAGIPALMHFVGN